MRFAWIAPPLAAVALAACQEEADLPIAGSDDCGASGWAQLIGEDRSALDGETLPKLVRIIGPNDAVTMDFLTNRLNIYYDEEEVITRLECG